MPIRLDDAKTRHNMVCRERRVAMIFVDEFLVQNVLAGRVGLCFWRMRHIQGHCVNGDSCRHRRAAETINEQFSALVHGNFVHTVVMG